MASVVVTKVRTLSLIARQLIDDVAIARYIQHNAVP